MLNPTIIIPRAIAQSVKGFPKNLIPKIHTTVLILNVLIVTNDNIRKILNVSPCTVIHSVNSNFFYFKNQDFCCNNNNALSFV